VIRVEYEHKHEQRFKPCLCSPHAFAHSGEIWVWILFVATIFDFDKNVKKNLLERFFA